jgi:hypothetical protein
VDGLELGRVPRSMLTHPGRGGYGVIIAWWIEESLGQG